MDKISTIKGRIFAFIESQGIKKTDFYQAVGLSESNFKGKNLSSQPGGDMIVKISTEYPILSLDWLIMGEGNMLKTKCTEDNQNTPTDTSKNDITQNKCKTKKVNKQEFSDNIQPLLRLIKEQAEEIGQLKERIAHLEREKGQVVSDAPTPHVANAG